MASSISQEWTASKIRKTPYLKANDAKWYFEIYYISKSWAKEGRSITKSNRKTYNSIGYETYEEYEKGK
jgi:hypothetical protein